MEYEIYGSKIPEDNWQVSGRTKEKDVRKMMKQLYVRRREIETDAESVMWAIMRFRRIIFGVVTPFDITGSQVVKDARMLKIPMFKEAFEKTYCIKIPQDYLDEVEYTATEPIYYKVDENESIANSQISE